MADDTETQPSLRAAPVPPRPRAPADRSVSRVVADCRRLISVRGDANSPMLAHEILGRITAFSDEQRLKLFEHLAREFNPDPQQVLALAQAYADSHRAGNAADALISLMRIAEPPRQELFRRLNRAPGGTGAIVQLRRALLDRLPRQPQLRALEADLLHLLGSWFNPGFLQLQKVSWDSPAQLLEQIIRHEAVHEVDGWDDLRRRLQPDRRCFAFFHPQLPAEPLIFVEVALLPDMPGAIAPLIDKKTPVVPAEAFRVAAFYSISNCQPGLRGVSLGNFLIKRVAEELKRELPQLKTFCTLSPIPGFVGWLTRLRDAGAQAGLAPGAAERAHQALAQLREACGDELATTLTHAAKLAGLPGDAHHALWRLAAVYLVQGSPQPNGDPVARFHLDNGARLERLNAQANLSHKGLKQSAGLMVNYLYDLSRIEAYHERFANGRVAHSRAISSLL